MQYVVKQLWLSGRGKKMFKSGDIVTSSDFPENIEKLVSEGRIEPLGNSMQEQKKEPVKEVEKEVEKEVAPPKELDEDAEEEYKNELEANKCLFTIQRDGEFVNVYTETDLNKKEVIAKLKEMQVAFNPVDKKDLLFDLIIANLK